MSELDKVSKPDPGDLEVFLPWVCTELQLKFELRIERILQRDFISGAGSDRGKTPKSMPQVSTASNANVLSDHDRMSSMSNEEVPNTLNVALVFDYIDNLIGIRLDRNRKIPGELIKLFGLVTPYHSHLTSITISTGLNAQVIYELTKILPQSKITDITLDGCFVEEGNYYLLLETKSSLTNLSLSRCQMGDSVVSLIAPRLVHPLPGSKLIALNLSTNRISDVGAKFLASALRSNMKLAYLNLADNMITDDGADFILNTFLEFYLTRDEVLAARQRNVKHLKARNLLVAQMLKELKDDLDIDKKSAKKRKTIASVPKKTKGFERDRETSIVQSIGDLNTLFLEKAEAMAFESIGVFTDPHSPENTVKRNDAVFCKGNKTLCYLNLAYNSLSYSTAKKMLEVVTYQNKGKNHKGLINVCLEGNPMPIACRELSMIDAILDAGLNRLCRTSMNLAQKKKPGKGVRA